MRWDHRAVLDWLNLPHMKRGMNPEGPGQAKMDSSGADNLGDGVWTHEPRCQLFQGDPQVEILGRTPNLLTQLVDRAAPAFSFGPQPS